MCGHLTAEPPWAPTFACWQFWVWSATSPRWPQTTNWGASCKTWPWSHPLHRHADAVPPPKWGLIFYPLDGKCFALVFGAGMAVALPSRGRFGDPSRS